MMVLSLRKRLRKRAKKFPSLKTEVYFYVNVYVSEQIKGGSLLIEITQRKRLRKNVKKLTSVER